MPKEYNRNILIINNDESVNELMEAFLQLHHYNTFCVANNQEAIKFMKDKRVDCVNTKISSKNNTQLIKELKKEANEQMKLIVITSYKEGEKIEENLVECGADEVLSLPYKPKNIIVTLSKLGVSNNILKIKADKKDVKKKIRSTG